MYNRKKVFFYAVEVLYFGTSHMKYSSDISSWKNYNHFPADSFKYSFVNEKFHILISSKNFLASFCAGDGTATGAKPLPTYMMIVTRRQTMSWLLNIIYL